MLHNTQIVSNSFRTILGSSWGYIVILFGVNFKLHGDNLGIILVLYWDLGGHLRAFGPHKCPQKVHLKSLLVLCALFG